MENQNSKTKPAVTSNGVLPEVKMAKTKKQKREWVNIEAIVGSIVVTPKEIEAFKKSGLDLLVALKTIQRKIYKKPKR